MLLEKHKHQNTSTKKQISDINEIRNIEMTKYYDLEERTFEFAKRVRLFIRKLPKTTANIEDGKQLVRSSGSVGANYIEANEAFSKKDFRFRIKICRKEAKESMFWLKLIYDINNDNEIDKIENKKLIEESIELKKILSMILIKSE